jgi:hypothetical protein
MKSLVYNTDNKERDEEEPRHRQQLLSGNIDHVVI